MAQRICSLTLLESPQRPVAPDGQLIRRVVHEARSPLTVIQMLAEGMMEAQDRPRGREAALIAEQAAQLGRLLEDALVLADDSAEPAESAVVDLCMVVAQAARSMARLAEQRGIHIQISAPDGGAAVVGDATALVRAVRGAIQGLLAVCAEGSDIVIALSEAGGALPQVEIAVWEAGPEVTSGGGQPAGGSLPWSKLPLQAAGRIVANHGGWMEQLEPAQGRGVRLLLPRRGRAAVARKEPAGPPLQTESETGQQRHNGVGVSAA